MFSTLLILSVMLTTEEDVEMAKRTAVQITLKTYTEQCVAEQALRFTRYTNESVSVVGKSAVKACAGRLSGAGMSTNEGLLFLNSLEATYTQMSLEWRARAGEDGANAYDQIQAEIDSKFCIRDCKKYDKPSSGENGR